MQWDDSPNAGFSPPGVQTWLPVNRNYEETNVSRQRQDPESTLNFYRTLLSLRRKMPALTRGDLTFVKEVPSDIVAYVRSVRGQRALVIINFKDSEHRLDLSALGQSGKRLLSSRFDPPGGVPMSELQVNPHESLLVELM